MESQGTLELEIAVADIPVGRLKEQLRQACSEAGAAVEFRPCDPSSSFRSVEPAVVTAVVAASGTALAALIAGLLAISKGRGARRIVIRSGDDSIEIPMEMLQKGNIDQLLELLERLKRMDQPRIHL